MAVFAVLEFGGVLQKSIHETALFAVYSDQVKRIWAAQTLVRLKGHFVPRYGLWELQK